jgi:hypothetical protein
MCAIGQIQSGVFAGDSGKYPAQPTIIDRAGMKTLIFTKER